MSNSAFKGYIALLSAQWQSDDGTLPNDMHELAEKSRLSDADWEDSSASILRKFTSIEGNRLRNEVCFQKWLDAKTIFEARQASAKKTNTVTARSPHGHRTVRKRSPGRSADTRTDTETYTETKERKPSGKPGTESRHKAFHDQIDRYWKHKTGEEKAPWDGSEGKALSALLAAKPDLTIEDFRRCLKHRGDSPDEVQTERPRQWLPNVLRFTGGPLDRYGKPLETKQPTLQLRGVTLEEAMQR
jgi:hypothetical protein